MSDFLNDGPADARWRLLLAHGAGAPMTSPFLDRFAGLLAASGLLVTRFEFPYMAARRSGGKRTPPPRAELLTGDYEAAVSEASATLAEGQRLAIGGKSLGGRVASLIADRLFRKGRIAGLVCLGYPFHPPGKPDQLRTAHLAALACPTLIVQGERDPFGTREEVAGYSLSPSIRVIWIAGAGHDLIVGRNPAARTESLAGAADAVEEFVAGLN